MRKMRGRQMARPRDILGEESEEVTDSIGDGQRMMKKMAPQPEPQSWALSHGPVHMEATICGRSFQIRG